MHLNQIPLQDASHGEGLATKAMEEGDVVDVLRSGDSPSLGPQASLAGSLDGTRSHVGTAELGHSVPTTLEAEVSVGK